MMQEALSLNSSEMVYPAGVIGSMVAIESGAGLSSNSKVTSNVPCLEFSSSCHSKT